jgi:Alpha-tubulin suppressor and related RCC1 domain-containing proteins
VTKLTKKVRQTSQQYIIQSTTAISSVAAVIPKISAARRNDLPFRSFMTNSLRSFGFSLLAGIGAAALIGCSETTAPVRRYPVLDDVGASQWSTVSVGTDHTCGLRVSGAAFCWGSNRDYQLGVAHGDSVCGTAGATYDCALAPQAVAPELKFVSISAGARHTCGITTNREAYCWGANDVGQVGDFAQTSPTPVKIAGSLGWTEISAGFSHTCAVRTDGALYCWGSNDRGQLGIGSQSGSSSMVRVPLSVPVASVSAGQQRTCARSTLGAVYCWGATWMSRSNGLEISRAQLTPQAVPNSPAMSWLSVGTFTTCGADVSGRAYCWEGNPRGQMGNGTQNGSTVPAPVASDLQFVQVSAGIVQSCGVVASGAGYCWGDDTFGQLGVSPSALIERCGAQNLPCATIPTPVFGAQQFKEISTGFGSHVCGVTVKGNLYCWGLGVSGQRGDGTASYATSTPILALDPGAKP